MLFHRQENSRSLNRKGMPKQRLQAISDIAVFWSSEGKKKQATPDLLAHVHVEDEDVAGGPGFSATHSFGLLVLTPTTAMI